MTEKDTQQAIIDLINWRGGLAIRVNSGMTLITDEATGKTRAIKHADQGTADVIACYRGYFISIEVKFGKNQPTPAQLEFMRLVQNAMGYAIVAWDTDAAARVLDLIDWRIDHPIDHPEAEKRL